MTPIANPAVAFLFILLLLVGVVVFVWMRAPEAASEPVKLSESGHTTVAGEDKNAVDWLVYPDYEQLDWMEECLGAPIGITEWPQVRIPIRKKT